MNYFSSISYMISHVFLMLFIYFFTRYRYSKVKTILTCLGAFASLCLLDQVKLIFYPGSAVCYFIVTLIQIFITQFTAIFISARRNSKTVFMGLSSSNYVIAGNISAAVLRICTGSTVISLAGSILVHLAILLLLSHRTREIWLRYIDREYMTNRWELCLIPVFFYCGFSCLTFFPFTLYDNPNNILATLIFIITMFVSYIVALRYMESESQKNNMYWKNILSEFYIKGLENQYHLVEQSERNMKILRHDMRHYSGMINSLLDQGEYEQIRLIAEHINEVTDENRVTKYCNNLIINTIFSRLMDQAHVIGVKVNYDIKVGKDIPVNQQELAIVIANLFENAVECVKGLEDTKRYVDVKIHCTDSYLLVQTKNECESEVAFDPVSGLPLSSKGGGHGFGMQSAQAFADKIKGNLGCYYEDGKNTDGKNTDGIFNIMLYAKF